jgi:hypothetical protein
MLLAELFGKTDDQGPYVNLSDGGHFENIGLYELVRRRCRLIIVSDASEDVDATFAAIGTAIERCRADFGAEINIVELDALRVDKNTGFARRNWVIGSIKYSSAEVDDRASQGTLLYLKPVVTNRSPVDVISYSRTHPQFPNHPTLDQWFTESQFEAYRELGRCVGVKCVEDIRGPFGTTQGLLNGAEEALIRSGWPNK